MSDAPDGAAERTFVDAVISELPGGVIVIDGEGKVVHANRTARRILTGGGSGEEEVEPEAVVGRLLHEIRAPLDAMRRAADKAEVIVPPVVAGESARIIGFSSRPLVETNFMVVSDPTASMVVRECQQQLMS